MRNYSDEFFSNIKLLDSFLAPFHQGILKKDQSRGVKWFLHQWSLWYSCFWVVIYAYLMLTQTTGPEIISQQMLSMMCVAQLAVKQINAKWQVGLLNKLLKWCEEIYKKKLNDEYQTVVNGVFEQTNSFISTGIRVNCILLGSATASYLLQPLLRGNRETPTLVSFNGVVYWPFKIFLIIYVGQVIYGMCVFFLLSGYDAIFIQCTMTMSYRFRTMSELLKLLNYSDPRDDEKDKQILGLIYRLHLNVLEATADFRKYYSVYGLVQLGTNLFMNCCLLFLLQSNGYDSNIVVILMSSSLQILIVSAFGQQLQDEANEFRNTLYIIEWPNMSLVNKRRLLMIMTGSYRVVNIRAGGTYELNLSLFAQVMKAGVSLCAVMQAM